MTYRSQVRFWIVVLAVAGWIPAAAQEVGSEEPELALIRPLAKESLLLDAAAAGGLMVAVGERGHVLLSHDEGAGWTQASRVETRRTLTAVTLHDEELGWAVGHDAVILRTRDGGDTWQLVYSAPEEQLPLLDVWFEDADRGMAIGAYGYFLETEDGGDTWSQIELSATDNGTAEDIFAYDEGGDFHLNHLSAAPSGNLFIAAEAGTIYRSTDRGMTWESLPSPYEGSFFGSLPLADGALLIFGLRGHLFRSDDAGESWAKLETDTQAMLTAGLQLDDGTVILVGLAGTVLSSSDGRSFTLHAQPDRQGYSSVLAVGNQLVLFGEHGVSRLAATDLDAD